MDLEAELSWWIQRRCNVLSRLDMYEQRADNKAEHWATRFGAKLALPIVRARVRQCNTAIFSLMDARRTLKSGHDDA